MMRQTLPLIKCLSDIKVVKLVGIFLYLTGLFLWAPLPSFSAVITWSGNGADNLASNPQNWQGGTLPQSLDTAHFGSLNPSKNCQWDITGLVYEIHLSTSFTATVSAAVGLSAHHIILEGGTFEMGPHEHNLSGNFLHSAGSFNAGLNGTLRFTGSDPKTISMVPAPISQTLYENYFFNLRISAPSLVTTTTDLIIDGSFSLSAGGFSVGDSTLTLTGGIHVGAGAGPKFNWNDTGGQFFVGSGAVRILGENREYRLNQRSGNTFHNLFIGGDHGTTVTTNLVVDNDLNVAPTGQDAVFDLGDFFTHTIHGKTTIGPSQFPSTGTVRLGNSSLSLMKDAVIHSATFLLEGGDLNILGPQLLIESQGTLHFIGKETEGRLRMANGSHLEIDEGSLKSTGLGQITSLLPGSARYSTLINGSVDFQWPLKLISMDKNGFLLGPRSNVINMKSVTFNYTPTGGVGLNFDPVAQRTILIDSPNFSSIVSTNIRANYVGGISPPNSEINVIYPAGIRSGSSFENDPSDVIHWGIAGRPQNFQGIALSTTEIQWTWQIVNEPLGFIVKDGDNIDVSSPLGANDSDWIESGLSPNTLYSRYVHAFTDDESLDSALSAQYTLASPPTNARFTMVAVSSITLAWDANGNPPHTVYRIEHKNEQGHFVQLSEGTLADSQPFTHTDLKPVTLHTYRVIAINGNLIETRPSSLTETLTKPQPPPVVFSIHPSTMVNLGRAPFTVKGAHFHKGAELFFRNRSGRIQFPMKTKVEDEQTITGIVQVSGIPRGLWDVLVKNPDEKRSTAHDLGLLTVTNASSTPNIAVHEYNPRERLRLKTDTGQTTLTIEPNAMEDTRIYMTEDPIEHPIIFDEATLQSSLENLSAWRVVPGSLREIVAFSDFGPLTRDFNADVFLTLEYPDLNDDKIVDAILTQASSLKIMTLNEVTLQWEDAGFSIVEIENNQVVARLKHFSIYGLFGAAPSLNLDNARIYPNPWKPLSGQIFDATSITFTGLTQSGSLKILGLDGRLVKQLTYDSNNAGNLTWDGRNSNGSQVASGIYFVLIEDSHGGRRLLKLGVER